MKYILIFLLVLFAAGCGDDTINNNGGSGNGDFDVYIYRMKENPRRFSTYTVKSDGTNLSLFNDSLTVSTRSKQNRILLVKFDTAGMFISAVYHAEASGTNLVRIPLGGNNVDYFDLSPQGDKMIFTSLSSSALNIMNLDGSGVIQLSSGVIGNQYSPKFSPNGQLVAFIETSAPSSIKGLYITNTSGTYKKLLKDSIYTSSMFSLDWSPDGSKIVYQNSLNNTADSRICTIDTSGSGYTILSTGGSPAWSPAGNKICFTDAITPSGIDIFIMNSDGSEKMNITNSSTLFEGNNLWSNDGSKILYSSQGTFFPPYYSIYDINTNSSRIVADSTYGAVWK